MDKPQICSAKVKKKRVEFESKGGEGQKSTHQEDFKNIFIYS